MRKKPIVLLATTVTMLLLLLSACASVSTPAPIALPTSAPAPEASPTSAHWTYEGEEGSAHWGELDAKYEMCAQGRSQSPIEISSPTEQDLANIVFHYQPSEVKILNNGHTVQVTYDSGSYIELDGVRYEVKQFHYHTPSEHQVDGVSFAGELHIVHTSADGNLAVLGLLLEEGSENAALAPFINNLPAEVTAETDAGVKINAMDFLPSIQTTYRYSGSLTTPPCSEGVNWLVMTTPVDLSPVQLSELESLFEANNRPVQPLNDRTLSEDSTP